MRILIADDEPKIGFLLASRLEGEGHFAKAVTSGNDALSELANGYELLITDLKMLDMDGIELMRRAREMLPELPVILMTAYASVDTAVSAMKAGAEDYIVKPFSLDEVVLLVARVELSHRMREELRFRRGGTSGKTVIVGDSPAMRSVMDMVDKVASSNATVLILGETGTGKELIATAIHERSPRSLGPFIAINCASLSEPLLESELFGHEKGAFTGAHRAKPGRFELADGGTLFLDEIGEIPFGVQAKLLRALQDGVIYRVGGINPIKVDVRLLAATNRDLKKAMDDGAFREDLYYRIAVFPIDVPRRDDIPALARHFLHRLGYSGGISDSAIALLRNARWRGNVRELFNVLERATILASGKEIGPSHFPPLETPLPAGSSGATTLDDMERAAFIDALRKAGGNKTEAAKILGITRRMVYSRMKKLGLSDSDIAI